MKWGFGGKVLWGAEKVNFSMKETVRDDLKVA